MNPNDGDSPDEKVDAPIPEESESPRPEEEDRSKRFLMTAGEMRPTTQEDLDAINKKYGTDLKLSPRQPVEPE